MKKIAVKLLDGEIVGWTAVTDADTSIVLRRENMPPGFPWPLGMADPLVLPIMSRPGYPPCIVATGLQIQAIQVSRGLVLAPLRSRRAPPSPTTP